MSRLPAFRSPIAVTLSAAVAALLFAGAASAAGPRPAATTEVVRVVVGYGDLNLDTDRGAAALQRRIVAAARQACGTPNPRELRLHQMARECTDAAIARAVEEVGSPRLARRHAGRSRAMRG